MNNIISNIQDVFKTYYKTIKTEKKEYGEVLTPIFLVEVMLNTLPNDVWSNPNLKWLDPCSGIGVFYLVAIERLMKGLESFEPNENLRYKHIIDNMLYACELQEDKAFIYKEIYNTKNIYNGSYLDEGFDEHMKLWGIDKFDVIVMNPPYNSPSKNKGVGHTLWDKFVIKSVNKLVEGGYLVAVHPDGYRSLGKGFDKVKQLLKQKQMIYLEVHNKKDGKKTFNVNTSYDFYCLHNVPNYMFTKIKCQDGKVESVDISKMEFIPNGMFKEFQNLLAKGNEERVEILYSRSAYGTDKKNTSKEQTEDFKYPVVYVTYKDGSINFMYSNTKEKGHYNIPKVIFSNGISYPIIDENGEYALTEFAYAIIDEPKNLPFIQKAMLSDDFIKLMSFSDGVTGTGHRYNRKVISMFRKDFWKEFLK